MAYTWEEIFAILKSRRDADSFLIRQMTAVRDRYNGDIIIPLPDVQGSPDLPAPMPMLVADAIDHGGMRASSTHPIISTPSDRNTEASRKRAEQRRKAWYGRWYESGLTDIALARAYRQWFGYGTTCLASKPRLGKDERPGAKIEIHDPLTVYPEPRSADDHRPPRNVGFVYGVSREWLLSRFPEAVADISHQMKASWYSEVLWDVVEWWDDDHRVMGLIGPRTAYLDQSKSSQSPWAEARWGGRELSRVPNRAMMVPVVTPRRITLDRIEGQVAKMVPREDLLGRLYSLEYLAAEKAVFPDMVAMGENGQQPQLVHGRWVDGREGEVNLVLDAKDVRLLHSQGSVAAFATTDRLERNARMAGGASPLNSGESPGASLRTGRALDAAASFAIDPRIQEAQRVMARNLGTLNEAIGAVEKGWFSGKKLWTFSAWAGETEKTEYDPADMYDTTLNVVSYQFPGADISQITVAVAQLTGAGLMSKGTARAKHPFIDDPEDESRRDVAERLIDAQLAGLLQRASVGELPEADLASIVKKVRNGSELFDAVIEVQKEAQERQAAQAPAPEAGLAPEAMPGLANPGAGAEMQPPDDAGAQIPSNAGTDLERLRQLLFDVNMSGQAAVQ